eukprot:g480.t1
MTAGGLDAKGLLKGSGAKQLKGSGDKQEQEQNGLLSASLQQLRRTATKYLKEEAGREAKHKYMGKDCAEHLQRLVERVADDLMKVSAGVALGRADAREICSVAIATEHV